MLCLHLSTVVPFRPAAAKTHEPHKRLYPRKGASPQGDAHLNFEATIIEIRIISKREYKSSVFFFSRNQIARRRVGKGHVATV